MCKAGNGTIYIAEGFREYMWEEGICFPLFSFLYENTCLWGITML